MRPKESISRALIDASSVVFSSARSIHSSHWSRSLGPIPAKIVGIDRRGAFDGGETYLIESPRLDGDAIETVRERLSRVKPVLVQ